jgi:deazaflavin-dependent oxidoreductase (nitroreductase family)
VTTKGRRTGRPHEIEIWFGLDRASLYLLSGAGGRADWVRNLRADATVRVRVGDLDLRGRARVVTDPEEEAMARRLLATKYQAWREGAPMSAWAGTALPVAIDVDG